MTDSLSILHYSPPAEISKELQLRARDGSVRVIFPMPPLWLDVLFIVLSGFNAAGNIALAVVLPILLRSIIPPNVNSTPGSDKLWYDIVKLSIMRLLIAVPWLLMAGLPLYRLKRWGRMPRRITATPSGLIVSQMGWIQPSHRFWAADRVTAMELRSKPGTVSQRTIATLHIRCRKWLPLTFRLSSIDSQLPTHIAERLAATLNCPLKIR
jgi:hypothetical protein